MHTFIYIQSVTKYCEEGCLKRSKIYKLTYKKNLILKQSSFASFFLPKASSTIIAASLFLACVSLLAVFDLEDSRIEDVDGSVVPQRSGHALGGFDSGRQQMGPDQKVCLLYPGEQR